ILHDAAGQCTDCVVSDCAPIFKSSDTARPHDFHLQVAANVAEIGCECIRYFLDALIKYRATPLNSDGHQTFGDIRAVDNPNASRTAGRWVERIIVSWPDEKVGNVFPTASTLIAIE